jgi:hypothetical protein
MGVQRRRLGISASSVYDFHRRIAAFTLIDSADVAISSKTVVFLDMVDLCKLIVLEMRSLQREIW